MSSCVVFFFKQKTAYEMRISDWSSDVCSSDLVIILGDNIAWATHSVANRHKTNFCHLIKRFVEALKLNQSQDKPCIQSCEVDRSGGFTIMRIIACARLFANRSIPQGQAAGADIDSSSLLLLPIRFLDEGVK